MKSLINMLPRFAELDPRNRGLANAELCTYLSLSHSAAVKEGADFTDSMGTKPCISVSLSPNQTLSPGAPATLGNHVSHIVKLRAEKQVVRPDAARVITAMQYLKTFWNRAVRQFIRVSMSSHCPATRADTDAQLPVSKTRDTAIPQPAVFGLLNFRPKTILSGRRLPVNITVVIPTHVVHFAPPARIVRTIATLKRTSTNGIVGAHRMLLTSGAVPEGVSAPLRRFIASILPCTGPKRILGIGHE